MLMQKPTCAKELEQFVSLGDVSRRELRMQAQYASRYVTGECPDEYPDVASDPSFGEPLRIFGDSGNYHSFMIHKDDAAAFVNRVTRFRNQV